MQSNLLQKELERLETSHSFRELLLFIHNWRRKRSPKGRSILFSSLMVFPDDFFYHFTKFESFRNSITFFWGQLVIIAKYYSLCCLPTYFPKRPFKPTFVESGLFTCRKKPFIGLRSPREANRRLREQNQLAFRLNCQFYSWLTVSDIYLIFVIFGPLMGFYLTNIFFFCQGQNQSSWPALRFHLFVLLRNQSYSGRQSGNTPFLKCTMDLSKFQESYLYLIYALQCSPTAFVENVG